MTHKPFLKQVISLTCLQYKSFENTVRKMRNCSHGILYPFEELSAIFIKLRIIVVKLF